MPAGPVLPGSSAHGPLIGSRLGHTPELDGVRGLAILLVFVMHFRYPLSSGRFDAVVNRVFESGWVGVDLFFVLSGFLITGILLEAKPTTHYFRNFYVRRVLRLFPVYYGTLFVLFVVLPIVLRELPPALLNILPHQAWYWTYAVNIFQNLYPADRANERSLYTTHLWSLSVEEQFYLLWPLIVRFLSRGALLRTCFAAIVLALGLRTLAAVLRWDAWTAYALTPSRMDALAIGACIAVLARERAGSALLRRCWRWVGVLAVAGAMTLGVWHGSYRLWDPPVFVIGYVLNALASAALITGLLAERSSLVLRPFQWRGLRWIGRCSYGAYVYHHLLLHPMTPVRTWFQQRAPVLGSGLPAECMWMLLMTVITLIIASASYRWFEVPFLKLKDRFAPGRG